MVRPDQDRIGGKCDPFVEADETYGGARACGERRGVHHKVLAAFAIESRHRKPGNTQARRRDGRYAGRIRLVIVQDRRAAIFGGLVERAIVPGTQIIMDDGCGYIGLPTRNHHYRAIAGCHDSTVAGISPSVIHFVFAETETRPLGIHHSHRVSAQNLQDNV